MGQKIKVTITLDKDVWERTKAHLKKFGGKVSSFVNETLATWCDAEDSFNKENPKRY